MNLHPACSALPELSPERYAELVESIREHGQEDPIIVHDGVVLDGRHRLRACGELGIEPRLEEWDGRGGDPVSFIALKQIRRDMTVSQRAAWAAEYVLPAEEEKAAERKASTLRQGDAAPDMEAFPHRDEGTARDKAGEAAGVSGRSVGEAKKIRDTSSELFEEVKSGNLSLAEAARRQKIAEKIQAFPEDERPKAEKFLRGVVERGNHTAKAVELADSLLQKPEEDRVRIYVLDESDDPKDQSLALTEAAGLPPMPHPALTHLRDASRSLAQAGRYLDGLDGKRLNGFRSEINSIVSTLKESAA